MKRGVWGRGLAFGLLSVMVPFLTACNSGFQSVDLAETCLGSLCASDFTLAVKGEEIYAAKCATCHLPLSNSTIKGATPQLISRALNTVSDMAPLRWQLSESEMSSVSAALRQITLPGSSAFTYTCRAPTSRGLGESKLRRLTRTETLNTLKALVGEVVFDDNQIQGRLRDLLKDEMSDSPTSISERHSVYHAKILADVALIASNLVINNPEARARVFGSCASQSVIAETCVRTYLQNFGLKVYRRPLTASEINRHFLFYQKFPAGTTGLRYSLALLLQSPAMAFHVEEGSDTLANGRVRLTDYEVASRISYRAAGTMPDAALFAAAQSGELRTLEGVKKHVERMMATATGRQKVQDFFRYYGRLTRVPVPADAVAASLGFPVTGLSDEMKQEAFDFANHIVWSKSGTFADLMTANLAFPKSERMAKIFETPVSVNGQPVTTRIQHSGFFNRPALLVGSSPRTSPILRGAHMRKDFLCDSLGAPPANAAQVAESTPIDYNTMTNREIVEAQTSGTSCKGCHTMINPIGFAFEGFDSLGRVRQSEHLFDSTGRIVKTYPLNTSVNQPMLDNNGGGPSALRDSVDLAQALAESYKARACFVKRVFEYYAVRDPDLAVDNCRLAEVEKAVQNGSLTSVFASDIANEDIFWRKASNL
jgi:hypothetical protein